MDFIILSIDESRAKKKDRIRELVAPWHERGVECVNGHIKGELKRAKLRSGIEVETMLVGEMGVWYSVVSAWVDIANNGSAVVFEDDALLQPHFRGIIDAAVKELPEDADFLAIFIPPNQAQDYLYRVAYDEDGFPFILANNIPEDKSQFNIGKSIITKAYMGYGNVCMYYTPQGAHKLIQLAKERRGYTHVDCFQFQESNRGAVNGYALHPRFRGLVDVDWNAPTLVHFGGLTNGDEDAED